MAHRPGIGGVRGASPLPGRHPRARDGLRDRHRCRPGHRLHAHPRGEPAGHPHRPGRPRQVAMRMDLAIRPGYGSIVPWGAPWTACSWPWPDPTPWRCGPRPHPRRGTGHRGRVHSGRRRARPVPPHVVPVQRKPAETRRCPLRRRRHRELVEGVVVALHVRGGVARRRHAVAHHPEGLDLRADRRDRRRAHHVAARDARRGSQLGLSLLLAARRHAHPRCP